MGRYVSNAGVPATRAAQQQRAGQPRREESENGEDIRERIVGQARKLVDDEIGTRLGQGATNLNRLSAELRGAGARLEGSFVGPYFERAAGQLEHVAELLKEANSREMIEGVQRFARERPLLYLGSAVALGIGAGRFLKSTSGMSESQSSDMPMLTSGSSTPSARRSARTKNREASQTRGTSHE